MNANAELEGSMLTLHVNGDLISTNSAAVRGEADELLAPSDATPARWKTFKLDLSSAAMIDSVGLNLVVSILKRVQSRGSNMQITYSNENILRTLTFTRLDKQVELVKV